MKLKSRQVRGGHPGDHRGKLTREPRPRFRGWRLLAATALLLGSASQLTAAPVDPAQFFRTNCTPCHTIGGGRLVGPDLKDVTTRQDRSWLVEFILSPQSKFEAQDPYALKILGEAMNVQMVSVAGMTADIAESLLDLIESESALERSAFGGPPKLPEPTEEDRSGGRKLFAGEQSLAGGGPPCISCHTVAGLGGLGGGRLGPDLTKAAERLGGMVGLYAWLTAPPTPQMQANFKEHPFTEAETFALAAYLDQAAAGSENGVFAGAITASFVALGAVGALGLLVVCGAIWSRRLRGVRKPLVNAARSTRKHFGLTAGGQNG